MKHQINLFLLMAFLFIGAQAVNAQTSKKPVLPDMKKKAELDQRREKIFAKLAEQKAQLRYEQKSFPAAAAQQGNNAAQQNPIPPAGSGAAASETKPKVMPGQKQ